MDISTLPSVRHPLWPFTWSLYVHRESLGLPEVARMGYKNRRQRRQGRKLARLEAERYFQAHRVICRFDI